MEGYNPDNRTNVLNDNFEEIYLTLTPLQYLIHKNKQIIKYMSEDEIKKQVNKLSKYDEWSPLMIAVVSGKFNLENIVVLAKLGAKIDAVNSNGETALMLACQHSDLEVVNLLISLKANVNIINTENEYTALFYILRKKFISNEGLMTKTVFNKKKEEFVKLQIDIVTALLKAGADVNYKDNFDNMTPLMYAVTTDSSQIVELLLNYKANLETKNLEGGETALLRAIAFLHINSGWSSVEIIEVLLKNGADPNTANKNGVTALMYACKAVLETKTSSKLIKMLIVSGAKYTEEDLKNCVRQSKINFEKWQAGQEEEKRNQQKWQKNAKKREEEEKRNAEEAEKEWQESEAKKEYDRAESSGQGQYFFKPPKNLVHNAREILGVSPTAGATKIKKAYHALALKYHPDKCTILTRKQAEEKFKEISNAYQSLI